MRLGRRLVAGCAAVPSCLCCMGEGQGGGAALPEDAFPLWQGGGDAGCDIEGEIVMV